jgi:hypothetical protein
VSADFEPDERPFHEPTNWRRLYATVGLAGALVGLLVVLRRFPAIPAQVTTWMDSVGKTTAVLVLILGGALVGLMLTAVAHLGVVLQLRRRSGPRTDRP